MKQILVVILGITFFLVACQPSIPKIETIFKKQLDLIEYGVPLVIQAPEDVKVKNEKDMLMQELTLEGKDYWVKIYGIDATNPNVGSLKSGKLVELKTDSYIKFNQLIAEDESSFLYELQAVGDTTKAYNFHYYTVKGNKEYHFTSSAGGRRPPFTKEQVTNMYRAIRPNAAVQ